MSYLLEELYYLVLSRLPVKSILRFRCVSKLWLNLIDSTYFANLHSYHTKRNSKTVILMGSYNHIEPLSVYALDFDVRNDANAEARDLKPPLPFIHCKVLACNNLICLVSDSRDRIVIWNPATHMHREVLLQVKWNHIFGFGYDYKTDDYKLVILEPFNYRMRRKETCYTVHVYSLKSNLWSHRPIKNGLGKLHRTPAVYFSGSLHWIDYHVPLKSLERKFEIVAFDLATEEWPMPPPMPPVSSTRLINMILSNHNGSLCASFHYIYNHVDFWVMKTEGINISWCKLFTVKDDDYLSGVGIMGRVIWKMNQQKVLIKCHSKLKWYDIEKETKEDVDVFGASYFVNSLACYEGLARV